MKRSSRLPPEGQDREEPRVLQLVARAYPPRDADKDDQVVARAVARVGSTLQPHSSARRKLRLSFALVLVGMLSGGALAAVAFRSQWRRPVAPLPGVQPHTTLTPLAPPPPQAVPKPAPAIIARPHAAAGAAAPAQTQETPHENGARRLFEEARRARALGWDALAAQRFSALLAQFPDSPEADVSRLAAGRLYRRLGDHAAALTSFSSYLKHNPGGPLEEEAMAGAAQSLESLGQDAAAAWQALAAAHPKSPYLKERAAKP